MIRLWIAVAVAAVAFTVYAIIDCASMPRQRVRSLRRGWWLVLVVLLPVLGGVLWFLLGRAPVGGGAGGPRYRGPDDDPDFLGTVHPAGRSASEKDHDDATLSDLEQQFRDDDGRGKPTV